jgi:hypothetical protein
MDSLFIIKTRFDLLKLFGDDSSHEIDRRNNLLRPLFGYNYETTVRNSYIYNKRMYS